MSAADLPITARTDGDVLTAISDGMVALLKEFYRSRADACEVLLSGRSRRVPAARWLLDGREDAARL